LPAACVIVPDKASKNTKKIERIFITGSPWVSLPPS
jgi:hypothetical protein